MAKQKWQITKMVRGWQVYARATRSEIIVRVEKPGDTSKYAEWGMPKAFGLEASMDQAALQTTEKDLKPEGE